MLNTSTADYSGGGGFGGGMWVFILAILFFCRGGWDEGRRGHGDDGLGRETMREQQFNHLELDSRLNRIEGKMDGNRLEALTYGNHKETNAELRGLGDKLNFNTYEQRKESDRAAYMGEKHTCDIIAAIKECCCQNDKHFLELKNEGVLLRKDAEITALKKEAEELRDKRLEDKICGRLEHEAKENHRFHALEEQLGRLTGLVAKVLEGRCDGGHYADYYRYEAVV